MAESNYTPNDVQSINAGADLSDKQFFFVTIGAAGTAILPTAAGQPCVGVNVENAANGEVTGIMTTAGKKIQVVAGGAIALGSEISSDANGKAKVAASDENILGRFWGDTAATADGNIISIIFQPQGVKA